MSSLTPHQQIAYDKITEWFFNGDHEVKQIFTFFGTAGGGKTYIISIFNELLKKKEKKVCVASYTGKAASVMRSRGVENAQTIHSLIYKAETSPDGGVAFTLDKDSELADADLLIVDEVSMVGAEGEDLVSFGVPILVVGDMKNQIAPLEGESFFYTENPDAYITEVVRQALDSPIISAATAVRENPNTDLNQFKHNDFSYLPVSRLTDRILLAADQIICGTHRTRRAIISRHNSLTGQGAVPGENARIVITRNDRDKLLFNGELATVLESYEVSTKEAIKELNRSKKKGVKNLSEKRVDWLISLLKKGEISPRHISALIKKDGEKESKWVNLYLGEYEEDNTGEKLSFKDKEARSIEYDLIKAFSMVVSTWGACLSTHKSQGSEFKKLILIDDGFGTWGDNAPETRRRWLYTSITRASEKLAIFHGRVA